MKVGIFSNSLDHELVSWANDHDITGQYKSRNELTRAAVAGRFELVAARSLTDLAGNLPELVQLLCHLYEAGVKLFVLEEKSRRSAALLNSAPALSRFHEETTSRLVTQRMSAAAERGVQLGRPSGLDKQSKARMYKLLEKGQTKTAIAQKMGVARTTIYRWLKEGEDE